MHGIGRLFIDHPGLAPVVFLLVFFPAISLVLARVSGWKALAERYRARGDFSGEKKRFRYGSLGWVGYNGCLTVGIGPEGIYLALFPPFSIGAPPLLIPWSDISNARESAHRFFKSFTCVAMDVGTPKVVTLKLWYYRLDAVKSWIQS